MPDESKPKPKPLTVAEVVSFQPPASLAGWKLVVDTNGVLSYRAKIGTVNFIGIPEQWEGRIMAQTVTNTGTNFGLKLNELPLAAEEFRTAAGTFRPEGAENVTLNGIAAVPTVPVAACDPPAPAGTSYDNLLMPGAIVIAAALYYFTGKRKA